MPGTGKVRNRDSIEAGTLQFPCSWPPSTSFPPSSGRSSSSSCSRARPTRSSPTCSACRRPRVRELARDALVELAPVSVRAVEEDWRGQLADYVLGQQAGPEATATKGHLRRSEAARSWTRSLLDSLDQLYPNGSMPAIPEGERGRRAAPQAAAAPRGLAGAPTRPDGSRRRRLLAAAGALAALVLLAVLVWPVGVLTGGDDGEPAAEQTAGAQREHSSQNAAPDAAGGGAPCRDRDRGRAERKEAAARPGRAARPEQGARGLRGLALQQRGRRPLARRPGHRPAGQLPGDRRRCRRTSTGYRFIDISREPLDQQRGHSGASVLRGRMPELRAAQPQGNQKTAVLGQSVLAPPAG